MTDDALDDLDASVRRTDPDRWLASRFIADADARDDGIALYAFDHELSRALGMKDALMAEIRLTWWAEVVAEVFEGRTVRRHPVSLALSQAVTRRDLPRAPLDAMVDARFALIGEPAHASEATEAAVTTLALRILGADDEDAAKAAAATRFAVIDRKTANRRLSNLPVAAFPAVAHAAVAPGQGASLRGRLGILWAVLRGRL